jgi:uncharacterized protein (DUF3084 family)
MQQSNQHRQALKNPARDALDFLQVLVGAVKDPDSLKPLVEAARQIDDANGVTARMLAEKEEVQKFLNGAVETRKVVAAEQKALEDIKKEIERREKKVGMREVFNDNRTGEIAEAVAQLGTDQGVLQTAQRKLATDQAQLETDQKKLSDDRAEVTRRETAVSEKEDNFEAAQKLLQSRKSAA